MGYKCNTTQSSIFQRGPRSGRRLVHLIPDEIAKAAPNAVLFSFAKTTEPEDGFVDVTSVAMAAAIDRAAWWLKNQHGPPTNFESIAYIGPNDLRYFIFMFAAMKVGYKMLYLSPRNSLAGHLNVLEQADCNIFIRGQATNIDDILAGRKMDSFVAPELEYFLDPAPVEHYPYDKSFDDARMDPCLVLHTTGSTGLPKPITWKMGILSTYDAWWTIPSLGGCVTAPEIYQKAERAYSSLPLFHTSGLNAGITFALVSGVTLVLGAPHVVPSAMYTDKMHRFAGVGASMGAPSTYEDLSQDDASCERLQKLAYITICGAPLGRKTGDLLSRHTTIINQIGATETACLPRLVPAPEDWAYYYWHPTHSGIELRDVGDDLYELFIVRNDDLKLLQGVFTTFPDIDEFSMKDVYSRHPDPAKPNLWLYRGRKDDVVVLSNGEKLTPASMESTLQTSPLIERAMVVGEHRFQPAALIEPAGEVPEGKAERMEFIKSILPLLKAVNKHAPGHGQLDEHHILLTKPGKPIVGLGQGKIMRRKTAELYEEEIEQLYQDAESGNVDDLQPSILDAPNFTNKAEVMNWLRSLFVEITQDKDLSDDYDIFEAGTDSLQVIRMSRELRLHAKRAGADADVVATLEPRCFYTYPTISGLAAFIYSQMLPKSAQLTQGDSHDLPTEEMQSILDYFAGTLPKGAPAVEPPVMENMTVVLTGSTGSLGSYLLDVLNRDSRVKNIICINRSLNAAGKHADIGPERDLATLDPRRVEFFHGDLAQENFGMSELRYKDLLQRATHVLHNQWPVNFNYSLKSFNPWIKGVRNLIQFSADAKYRPFLFFTSSVATANAWGSGDRIPEAPIHDGGAAAPIGYGRSKQLGERLLDVAARKSGVPSAATRIGLIGGPADSALGKWDVSHYVPAIFISSAHLGIFPSEFPSRDSVDWLPVDRTAKILVDQMMHSSSQSPEVLSAGTQVFHALNPHAASWSDIARSAPSLYERYYASVKLGSFSEWLDRVREAGPGPTNPAFKLLDFYQGLHKRHTEQRWSMDKSTAASRTLAEIEPVNEDWVRQWMHQWRNEISA